MGSGNKRKAESVASLVITAVIALAAIAAVIVLVVILKGNKQASESEALQQQQQQQNTLLLNECAQAANSLVQGNYSVLKLFVTEGLEYTTIYGNPAEDGYHSVDDEVYKHYTQIEELVKSVYVESEAERILTRFPVATESGTRDMQVYTEHKDSVDGEMKLGINENFVPDESYNKDWSKCSVQVHPENDLECTLTVILDGYTESDADTHPQSVVSAKMVKQNGEWRLSVMLQ